MSGRLIAPLRISMSTQGYPLLSRTPTSIAITTTPTPFFTNTSSTLIAQNRCTTAALTTAASSPTAWSQGCERLRLLEAVTISLNQWTTPFSTFSDLHNSSSCNNAQILTLAHPRTRCLLSNLVPWGYLFRVSLFEEGRHPIPLNNSGCLPEQCPLDWQILEADHHTRRLNSLVYKVAQPDRNSPP